jgi:hypothetical protein
MAETLINHSDVAASQFNQFEPCKKHLAAKRFVTNADAKQALTSWLQTLDIDFYSSGIQAMMPLWCISLNVSGDYASVWCVPSATHVPCECGSYSKVVDTTVFLSLWIVLLTTLYGRCRK